MTSKIKITAGGLMAISFTAFAGKDITGTIPVAKGMKPEWPSLAKVTLAEAEQIALSAVPGGRLQESDLEREDGFLVYDIEVMGPDGLEREFLIDAGNGKVLLQELDD